MLKMLLVVMAAIAVAAPALADPWKHKHHGGPPWSAGYDYPTVIVPSVIVVEDPALAVVDMPPLPPGPDYGEPYRDEDERLCREYQTTAKIEGRRERLYGTVCLQPDGSWSFNN